MKKKRNRRIPSEVMVSHLRGAGLVILCGLLFLAGSYYTREQIVAVSSMQQQKELPVYCVQTEKPQVALSFDAAWGNVRYGFFFNTWVFSGNSHFGTQKNGQ